MDLIKIAELVSDKYLKSNLDMNSSIAKYASDNSLTIDQTKRLVEECNKSCYLKKFASTGEQTFNVADFEKVKSLVKEFNTPEKTASINLKTINYNSNEEDMQKIANESVPDLSVYDKAIDKCNYEYSNLMNKLDGLFKQASIYLSFEDMSDMTKVASNNNIPESLRDSIQTLLAEADHHSAIANHLIEKRAGILSATSGIALKGAGKAIGFVAAAPMKRGLQPLMYEQTFKTGAKKFADKEASNFVGNTNMATDIMKKANFLTEAIEIAKTEAPKMAPWLLLAGAVGVTTSVARGMGGMASRMMDDKQLEESFNTIMETHKDLRDIPGARDYFNVIARHSPDIAKDPMVAPQLIRQFDTFGGVDLNTVGKLRELQNRLGPQSKGGSSNFDTLQTAGNIHSLVSKK